MVLLEGIFLRQIDLYLSCGEGARNASGVSVKSFENPSRELRLSASSKSVCPSFDASL